MAPRSLSPSRAALVAGDDAQATDRSDETPATPATKGQTAPEIVGQEVFGAIRMVADGSARTVQLCNVTLDATALDEAGVHALAAGVALRIDRVEGSVVTLVIGPREAPRA